VCPTNFPSLQNFSRVKPILFFLSFFLWWAGGVRAQTPGDPAGDILFPSGPEDLGALPFSIGRLEAGGFASGERTLAGLLSTQAGWPNSLGQGGVGLRSMAPALLFEGVAYPLASPGILAWAPALGSLEFLDFPAQAWWGPSAAAGAIGLRAIDWTGRPQGSLTLAGGSGNSADLSGAYSDLGLALSGNYRRAAGDSPPSSLGLSGKAHFLSDDDFDLSSAFLGLRKDLGDYWGLWVGDFQWNDADFQRVRLRPYFQAAQGEGQDAREGGANLDYDLNLAGLAEANLAAGFSRQIGSAAPGGRDAGFIQDTELIDALGDFSADLALRLDFPGQGRSFFSTALGVQYTEGKATFRADYAASAALPAEQVELGVSLKGDDPDGLDFSVLHESGAFGPFNGARLGAVKGLGFLDGELLEDAQIQARFQDLAELSGKNFTDLTASFRGRLFRRLEAQVGARLIQGGTLLGEARLACELNSHCSIFLDGENLGGNPVPWPEPQDAPGFHLMGGVTLTL